MLHACTLERKQYTNTLVAFCCTSVCCWQADLKGINEAKNYWQAYFDKYTFEHEVLAGAVDKEAIVAFSFWLDKVNL